jgi:recombinational DNA repair protein (RecF pathway)
MSSLEAFHQFLDAKHCECCGERGLHKGCALLHGRIICRRCISVWYDSGLTNPAEIGVESKRWRDDPQHWYTKGRREMADVIGGK